MFAVLDPKIAALSPYNSYISRIHLDDPPANITEVCKFLKPQTMHGTSRWIAIWHHCPRRNNPTSKRLPLLMNVWRPLTALKAARKALSD
jgi:hypothetical protein